MNTKVRVLIASAAVSVLVVGGHVPNMTMATDPAVSAAAGLDDLKGVEELKALFNQDSGKPRLVLLLSPTRPVCVAGTRWVQKELLAKYPKADVRVYAVWFNMYRGDARSKWPPSLLTDARVVHRWDEGKLVGRWYGDRTAPMRARLTPESAWNGEILWDTYLLYGANGKWDETPTGLIHWGRTIVAGRATLRHDFERLFGGTP